MLYIPVQLTPKKKYKNIRVIPSQCYVCIMGVICQSAALCFTQHTVFSRQLVIDLHSPPLIPVIVLYSLILL